MSAHIPERWSWRESGHGYLIENVLGAVAVAFGPETDNGALTGVISSDESERNARLIAAAPELLAALEQMVASAFPHPVEHPSMTAAWAVARSAIAKARGAR